MVDRGYFTNLAVDLSFVDERVRCHVPIDTMTPLPFGWVPKNWDVICGRGSYNHSKSTKSSSTESGWNYYQTATHTLDMRPTSFFILSITPTVGNRRFRILVDLHVPRYRQAKNRMEKSIVVMEVVDTIRDSSKEGGFVRHDSNRNRWFEVSHLLNLKTLVNETIMTTKWKETNFNYATFLLNRQWSKRLEMKLRGRRSVSNSEMLLHCLIQANIKERKGNRWKEKWQKQIPRNDVKLRNQRKIPKWR